MADETPDATPTDWRGTPITEGALVIYGAPVGRSIALVEAEVVGFTQSGRVNVRITRRAYGGGSKDVVHVGTDRLIVVHELPPTEVPTQDEANDIRAAEVAERRRLRETHDLPDPLREDWRLTYPPCRRCGWEPYTAQELKECPA